MPVNKNGEKVPMCCFLCGAIAGPLTTRFCDGNFIQIGESVAPLVTQALFEGARLLRQRFVPRSLPVITLVKAGD